MVPLTNLQLVPLEAISYQRQPGNAERLRQTMTPMVTIVHIGETVGTEGTISRHKCANGIDTNFDILNFPCVYFEISFIC